MKKTYLKSAIATLGIFTTSIALQAQGAGGGGGGAGGGAAGGAAAGGAAAGGAAVGGRAAVGGTGARATTGARSGAVTSGTARGLNTQGGASILSPSATPPAGAASTLVNPQNTVGGSASGNTFLSPATTATAGSTATLPSANTQQAIPLNTLPTAVQTALGGIGANGQVGSVTQMQGVNGPVYRAEVTENGIPTELQISQTGQILSRTPGVGGVGGVGAAGAAGAVAPTTLGNTLQAGLPLSSLPESVQSSLQTQLGANGQVQTISRDDLANGTVYRVTTTQNGVPSEMRFAGNGTFLGSTPLNGTLTSSFVPSGGILPGTSVVMSDLPADVQGAIRSNLGSARLGQLTRLQGTNGVMYAVSYDQNGRPMVMTIGPDGRVISNNPINTGVGTAGARTTGTGSSTNSATRTNSSTRTSMRMEDLPSPVQETLRREARGAEVRSATREQRVGGDIYTVAVRGDNNVGELTIDQNGKLLNDNRRNFTELSVPKINLDDEKVTGIPYSTVPIAIKDAVKAYATASDIRSITLGTDRDGKTVYDVVYYHAGQRDRMIVSKDGTVRRMEQNVSPSLEIPDPKKAPVIALGDLPQPVRDTIRRQTDGVLVKDITTKQVGSDTVYQVHYQTNGAPVELLVSTDGRVVLPEGSVDREAAGAPAQAPVTPDELASAKVVAANEVPAKRPNTGAAASTERGSVSSPSSTTTPSTSAESTPTSNVSISDVPVPVQNTAKKLAGSATIDSISPKLSDAGVTYEVAFLQNGARKTVVVNKDGVVVKE